MSLWERLLRTLGYERTREPRRIFEFDPELTRSLRLLAEQEQRGEDEIASELLSNALVQRSMVEDHLRRWQTLSYREQQVVALACLDYTNRQIAAKLRISPETVKTHVQNALRKFNMRSKAELRSALADWDLSPWRDHL